MLGQFPGGNDLKHSETRNKMSVKTQDRLTKSQTRIKGILEFGKFQKR